MWMLPLYLHVNQKSVDDDDDDGDADVQSYIFVGQMYSQGSFQRGQWV